MSLLASPELLAAMMPPQLRHLSFGRKEIRDEIMTMGIFNTETREGYHFQMTVTDCYVTRYIRRPIFGGPGKYIRMLDDVKLAEKLKLHLTQDLRDLGWIKDV